MTFSHLFCRSKRPHTGTPAATLLSQTPTNSTRQQRTSPLKRSPPQGWPCPLHFVISHLHIGGCSEAASISPPSPTTTSEVLVTALRYRPCFHSGLSAPFYSKSAAGSDAHALSRGGSITKQIQNSRIKQTLRLKRYQPGQSRTLWEKRIGKEERL